MTAAAGPERRDQRRLWGCSRRRDRGGAVRTRRLLVLVCLIGMACGGEPAPDDAPPGVGGAEAAESSSGGSPQPQGEDGAGSDTTGGSPPAGDGPDETLCADVCEAWDSQRVFRRVVAFGSLDGDGRADPAPLAGVTIVGIPIGAEHSIGDYDFIDGATGERIDSTRRAVCEAYRELAWSPLCNLRGPYSSWLHHVGGVAASQQRLRIENRHAAEQDLIVGHPPALPPIGIPVGEQMHASADRILSVPGVVVATTGADGAAKIWADRDSRYAVCALSPSEPGLIAGCAHQMDIGTSHRLDEQHGTGLTSPSGALIVYFSHGRAYFANTSDNPRYRAWFQPLAQSVFRGGFGRDWSAPVTLGAPTHPQQAPAPDGQAAFDIVYVNRNDSGFSTTLAFVSDADIGRWWDAVSGPDPHAYSDEDNVLVSTPEFVETSPAQLFTFEVPPKVLESEDPGHIGTVTVPAGVYLTCRLSTRLHATNASAPKGELLAEPPPLAVHADTPTATTSITACRYDEFPASTHRSLLLGHGEHTVTLRLGEAGYRPQRIRPGDPVPE